jgi:hypothetical protein
MDKFKVQFIKSLILYVRRCGAINKQAIGS